MEMRLCLFGYVACMACRIARIYIGRVASILLKSVGRKNTGVQVVRIFFRCRVRRMDRI
jgi:hypothetical protein